MYSVRLIYYSPNSYFLNELYHQTNFTHLFDNNNNNTLSLLQAKKYIHSQDYNKNLLIFKLI